MSIYAVRLSEWMIRLCLVFDKQNDMQLRFFAFRKSWLLLARFSLIQVTFSTPYKPSALLLKFHWKIHLNACLLPCEISHIASSARSSLNNLILTSIHLQSHLLLACIFFLSLEFFFCEKLFFSSEQSEADLYVLERRCLLLMIVVYGRFTLTLHALYLFKWKKNRKDHYCCKIEKCKRTT